jgi:hypothetical protein
VPNREQGTVNKVHFAPSARRGIKACATFGFMVGLFLTAQAQLGTGWTPDNETYTPQTSTGCTITAIPGGYEFSVPSGGSSEGRAEMRGNNLPTTTTNEWQGLGTLKSYPSGSNEICMHQVFGPDPSTPDLILDETTHSGKIEIESYNNNSSAIEAQIQVGVPFQLNTVYDPVGKLITIYVNGAQTGTKVPNSGVHYNKFGQYVSTSGTGPATFDWVNIESWSGGTAASGTMVATPSFGLPAGTYAGTQSVTISDATSGASIRYTTDGVTPPGETTGTIYTGTPVSISSTTTLQAIAYESGYADSSIVNAVYTITPQAAIPTFNPGAGTYTSAQSVAISSTTSGASISYTTDNSTPTETHGTVVSNGGTVSIGANTTLKAMAFESGYADSNVGTAIYTITPPAAQPTFSPGAGTYTSGQSVAISSTTSGASISYTTDNSPPTETHGTVVPNGGTALISTNATLKAMAFESGFTDSTVGSAIYTFSAPIPTLLHVEGSNGER